MFCQDADVYFPGYDKFTLWNADISTVSSEFWSVVGEMAFQQAWESLTEEERNEESRMDFIPATRSRTGKVLTYQLAIREKRRYAQFENRTFREQVHFLEKHIIENNPPVIHEYFAIDRNYAYGFGLRMVVDEEAISVDAINRAIERFRLMGEIEWRSDVPVPAHRLPKNTEREEILEQKASYAMKGHLVRMDF